jgi:hypothetical protein
MLMQDPLLHGAAVPVAARDVSLPVDTRYHVPSSLLYRSGRGWILFRFENDHKYRRNQQRLCLKVIKTWGVCVAPWPPAHRHVALGLYHLWYIQATKPY